MKKKAQGRLAPRSGTDTRRDREPAREPNGTSEPRVLKAVLDPKRRETLIRRLIDGKAGAVELALWDVADFEEEPPRRPTLFRHINRKGEDITPPQLNAVGAAQAPQRSEVKEWARGLLMEPRYQEALERRIDDGKASVIHARLVRIKAKQSHAEPQKEPFTLMNAYGDFLFWDARSDPMREKCERMIEAKERKEKEARAQQATPGKQAAAVPEDSEEFEELEAVDVRDFGEPPPHDRSW